MKPIRLTKHAREQCIERGATEAEVVEAIRTGAHESAKSGRNLCRYNFTFGQNWNGHHYAITTPSNKSRPSSKRKPTK